MLLDHLEKLELRGKSATAREVHRQVTGYIRNSVHRMDYPRYQANGWLIGSGHVEAGCKAVVGQRLKGNGMRWSEAGANAVCHLRALVNSDAHQWETFWACAAGNVTDLNDAHPTKCRRLGDPAREWFLFASPLAGRGRQDDCRPQNLWRICTLSHRKGRGSVYRSECTPLRLAWSTFPRLVPG